MWSGSPSRLCSLRGGLLSASPCQPLWLGDESGSWRFSLVSPRWRGSWVSRDARASYLVTENLLPALRQTGSLLFGHTAPRQLYTSGGYVSPSWEIYAGFRRHRCASVSSTSGPLSGLAPSRACTHGGRHGYCHSVSLEPGSTTCSRGCGYIGPVAGIRLYGLWGAFWVSRMLSRQLHAHDDRRIVASGEANTCDDRKSCRRWRKTLSAASLVTFVFVGESPSARRSINFTRVVAPTRLSVVRSDGRDHSRQLGT